MATDKIRIEIVADLDEKSVVTSFKNLEKQAEESGDKASKNLKKSFSGGIGNSFKSVFGGIFDALTGKVAALGAAVGTAFAARGILKAGVTIDRLETQFGTLLGSTAAAQKQIQELTNFAATTPFQLEGLADASAQLLSFGFESDTLIDRLGKIGDVASGSNSDLKDVALIYGQISAAGKLTGERLLQLQERAIPIGAALADSLGVAESEVRGLVSSGKVGFKEFEAAFNSLSAAGGLFEGSTKKQSQTLGGLISTLQDNLFALQVQFAKAFGPFAKALLEQGIGALQQFTASVKSNSATITQTIFSIARGVNDFVVPVFVGLGRVAEIVFRSVVVGINTIVAGFGKLAQAGGKVLEFFGQGGAVSEALTNFGESSEQVLLESIDPLSNALTGIFNPIAFQENADSFLNTLQASVESAKISGAELAAAFDKNNKKIVKTTKQTGKEVANVINQAVVQTTSKGIQSLTKSLLLGESGFRNFGKQVFAILGDLAIKLGETTLLAGLGIESLKTLSGTAAIAAGAGLIALGTILKSLGDGPGLSGAPAGAGASGFVGGLPGADPTLVDQPEEREEPDARVAVNINGDVFDSDETGTRISQILSETFQTNGIVISNGSFA